MGAKISPCGLYRYRLDRDVILFGRGVVNFIMLNPSKADAVHNDSTVSRCEKRVMRLGWPRMVVTNLFAWRSTDPSVLLKVKDPIGPDNDLEILQAAQEADLVVCAWGNHGALHSRAEHVVRMLRDAGVKLHALRVTGAGQPEHPLYLPYRLKPKPWKGLQIAA